MKSLPSTPMFTFRSAYPVLKPIVPASRSATTSIPPISTSYETKTRVYHSGATALDPPNYYYENQFKEKGIN